MKKSGDEQFFEGLTMMITWSPAQQKLVFTWFLTFFPSACLGLSSSPPGALSTLFPCKPTKMNQRDFSKTRQLRKLTPPTFHAFVVAFVFLRRGVRTTEQKDGFEYLYFFLDEFFPLLRVLPLLLFNLNSLTY